MKTILILSALLLFSINAYSQVIISPYVVYTDHKTKSATLIVTNNSSEIQEVAVSTKFGYPISDKDGNIKMEYPDSTNKNSQDVTKYVKVFPKKFYLEPGEQQTVRLSVKAPVDLTIGTYWTRIVTTTKTKDSSGMVSSNPGFANVKLILSQVTTLIFRNKRYENSISITDIIESVSKDELNLMLYYNVSGDSPFFADSRIRIFDSMNTMVDEKRESFSIYNSMIRRSTIGIRSLEPGTYCAEISVQSNLKDDVPVSDKPVKSPLIKKVYFKIGE